MENEPFTFNEKLRLIKKQYTKYIGSLPSTPDLTFNEYSNLFLQEEILREMKPNSIYEDDDD